MNSQQLLLAYGESPLITVKSAFFDGVSAYLNRGSALTGVANGKSAIFSAWIRCDAGSGVEIDFAYIVATGWFDVLRGTNNKFAMVARNAAGTIILNLITSGFSYSSTTTWYHVLMSWDLAAGVSNLYINDVSDKTSPTLTNDTAVYTGTDFQVGAFNGGLLHSCCLAEYYFAPNQYLDFSITSNRRKFISSSGKPVWLGADGSLPTGTAPAVYLHIGSTGVATDFATNLGSGGNLSINGSLSIGSTSPSG